MTASLFKTAKHNRQQSIMHCIVVAGVLLLTTLLIYLTDGDRGVAEVIFGSEGVWPGIDRFPWNVLYTWAPVPGFLLAGCSLLILIAGFFFQTMKQWRREAVFLLLLLAIGPGLIVNVLLKDQVGRARPREIVEFGGAHQYTEFWEKGTTGANSSFPSGHASIAFYTLAPWFIFRKRNRGLAAGALIFGVGFGTAVGLTRMLQGGHFLSDVVWAGGIVYLVGLVLSLFLLPSDIPEPVEQKE